MSITAVRNAWRKLFGRPPQRVKVNMPPDPMRLLFWCGGEYDAVEELRRMRPEMR